ncbi:transmembrane protein 138 isoform X3 [Desmodus rotundus]|uniref:transmembrane protein 138 isoform X3 n=1 Tax=Desmodus rotundus TaxID=9430 RepID=UPI0039E2D4FC
MLQTSNYSLVLSLQFLLLCYDLFVNSFSELLRAAPVIQLVLFMLAWSTSCSISSKGPSSWQLCTSPSASPCTSGSWPQCPKGSSQARMLLAFLCFTPSAATHRLHWGNHPLRCLPVVLRTYAGKSLTALSGQMDFKRCLHSRG